MTVEDRVKDVLGELLWTLELEGHGRVEFFGEDFKRALAGAIERGVRGAVEGERDRCVGWVRHLVSWYEADGAIRAILEWKSPPVTTAQVPPAPPPSAGPSGPARPPGASSPP